MLLMSYVTLSNASATSSAQFLKMGAGARAAGMADAFSAVADDVTAGYWNPAGLQQISSPEMSVMQNNSLVETQYQYAGAALPMGRSAIGLSLFSMNYGSIDRYSASDAKDGSFSAGSMAGSLTLSSQLREGLNFGISTKYIQEKIENESATGFAADIGLLMKTGAARWSATVQHLGPQMKFIQEKSSLPLTFRLGSSATVMNKSLTVALDAIKPNDSALSIAGGVEYKPVSMITFRGGYKLQTSNSVKADNSTGLTAGLGVNVGAFILDYAFVPFGDLGNTHRFSLLVKFHQK